MICAEDEALKLIARIAEGGMRDSLSKLDQAIAFCGDSVTAADVERIFGILSRANLLELIEGFAARNFELALGVAARIHDEGLDVSQVLRDLIDLFRDLAVVKTCGSNTPLVDAMADDRAVMEQVAGNLETDTLLYAVDILMEGLARIRSAGFPRLALEMTFIKLAELEDLVPLPALIEAAAGGAALPAAVGSNRPRAAAPTAPTVSAASAASAASARPTSAPTAATAAVDSPPAKKLDFKSVLPTPSKDAKDSSGKGGSTTKKSSKKKTEVESASETPDAALPEPAAAPPPAAPPPAAPPPPAPAPAPPGANDTDTRSMGERLIDNINAPSRPRGPGVASQLRDQDSVRLLIDKFEGEIIRVEESER